MYHREDIIKAAKEVQDLRDILKEPLEEALSNLVFSTIAHHTEMPVSPEITVTFNESDKTINDKEPIFELIKPHEIFLLYKDSDGIVYLKNIDGELYMVKLPLKYD